MKNYYNTGEQSAIIDQNIGGCDFDWIRLSLSIAEKHS